MEPLIDLYGRVVLMVGNEALHWSAQDIGTLAEFCRAHQIDAVSVKVADGTWIWRSQAEVQAWRASCLAAGVGFVPFMYSYGGKFGGLQGEAALMLELISSNENAGCIVDMEGEWEGQDAWATELATLLAPKAGPLIISTWANPREHNFLGVLEGLRPVVDGIGPQQYTDYLGAQEGQFPDWAQALLMPEINLTGAFGPNDQMAKARQAKAAGRSVWLWEYQTAITNRGLTDQIASYLKDGQTVTPEEAPKTVTVGLWPAWNGALWSIAKQYGMSLSALLALPGNAAYRGDPGLIHPGDVVQVG